MMQVRDVMSVGVITVTPDMAIKDAAQTLLRARIGGAPVVEGDNVVGILSSSDILEAQTHPTAQTVRDVMTADPVCLVEDVAVTAAARVLAYHKIKRAPVVRGQRLVGIVTRTDLLRPYLRTDSEILAEIEGVVLGEMLGISPRDVHVQVSNGVAVLRGRVQSERQSRLLPRLAESVDGVIAVIDQLYTEPEISEGSPAVNGHRTATTG